jgi:DNA-directed RNA polymerase subunit M
MRLTPTRTKEAKETVFSLHCPKCDYNKRVTQSLVVPLKIVEHGPQEKVAVIGEKEQKLRTLPTVNVECPRCGNNVAYAWQVQTRGADESSTQFFRCTKCNHTFREYT